MLLLALVQYLLPNETNISVMNFSNYSLVLIEERPAFVFYNDSPVLNTSIIKYVLKEYYLSKARFDNQSVEHLKNLTIAFNASKEPLLSKCKQYSYYKFYGCPFKHSCEMVAQLLCDEFFTGVCKPYELAPVLEEFGLKVHNYEESMERFYQSLRPDAMAMINASDALQNLSTTAHDLEFARVYYIKGCGDCVGFCWPVKFNWTRFEVLNQTYYNLTRELMPLKELDSLATEMETNAEQRIIYREMKENQTFWSYRLNQTEVKINQTLINASLLLNQVNDAKLEEKVEEINETLQSMQTALAHARFDELSEQYKTLMTKLQTLRSRMYMERQDLEDLLELYSKTEANAYLNNENPPLDVQFPLQPEEVSAKKNLLLGFLVKSPLQVKPPLYRLRPIPLLEGWPRHVIMLFGGAIFGWLLSYYFQRKHNPAFATIGLLTLGLSLLTPTSDPYGFLQHVDSVKKLCVVSNQTYIIDRLNQTLSTYNITVERCMAPPYVEIRMGNETSYFDENHAIIYERVNGACGVCYLFSSYFSH